MAAPHLGEARPSVIALDDRSGVDKIETLGPAFFTRSYESTPDLWADLFFGPNRHRMHVIEKETLKIVRTLQPVPGATNAAFDRDGRHILVSIWEERGAVTVYDAAALEAVKRPSYGETSQ